MTDPRITEDLRQAFENRAARVATAPDALVTIRRRIGSTARRRRVWTVGIAGLATCAAAAVTAVVLTLPWSTPAPSPSVGNVAAAGLPVYEVGPAGRLYREYHAGPAGGGGLDEQIRAALTDMIAGRTLDPDYHSDWPAAATVHSVRTTGATITVALSVPAGTPGGAAAALQQLVYTATAVAAQSGAPQLSTVTLDLGGAGTLWGIDVSAPLRRASAVDTLAPVWLSAPQEGDVDGRTVKIQVVATVPGAVAMLIVWNADGSVVYQQALAVHPATQGSATRELTLSPGRYRIEAYYLADDGTAAAPDDHVITVR